MSFASVCVANEPLCLPAGANRKAVKEGSGMGRAGLFRIRRQSSSVFSCTVVGCCRTAKDEGEPGKAPSRPQHKEAHRDGTDVAAIICAYCAVVLFSVRRSRADADSQPRRVREKLRWNIFPLKLSFSQSVLFIYCNFLFCVQILPDPL